MLLSPLIGADQERTVDVLVVPEAVRLVTLVGATGMIGVGVGIGVGVADGVGVGVGVTVGVGVGVTVGVGVGVGVTPPLTNGCGYW